MLVDVSLAHASPSRLTCQGGLLVELWPNKPEVRGSDPSIVRENFNLKKTLLQTGIWHNIQIRENVY